jgi:hypothetical protein
VAAVAALSLAAAGVVGLMASPASAVDDQTVTPISSSWGIKESWRNYMPAATLSGGAALTDSANPKSAYSWPAASTASTYAPSTGIGSINLGGTASYSKPDNTIYKLAFSNPTLNLTGSGQGTLVVDNEYDLYDGAAKKLGNDLRVVLGTLTGATPTTTTVCGQTTHTFANVAVTLTDAGSNAFGGFYTAGTTIDPFNVTVASGTAECPTMTTGVASPTTAMYGKSRTITANVSAGAGKPVPTGTVSLYEGSKYLGYRTLSAGKAVFGLPSNQTVATHYYTLKYSGSAIHTKSVSAPIKQNVIRATTLTKMSMASSQVTAAKAGKRAWVTFTVQAVGAKPAGTVVIKDGTRAIATTTFSNGAGKVLLPVLAKGTHRLSAAFLTNAQYTTSVSATVTLVRS